MVTFKFDYTCLYFTCFLQCPNKCCVKTAQLKLNTIYISFKAYFQSGNTHKVLKGGKGQSRFTVEWTNQHGCSNKDLNCNIVLQYMCQPDTDTMKENTIRNGMLLVRLWLINNLFSTMHACWILTIKNHKYIHWHL